MEAGIAAQNAQDFDGAIALYEEAFALTLHPILLFNIAQAHRLAGRSEQALRYYERYLSVEPSGSQSAAARAIVAAFYLDTALDQRQKGQALDARVSLERGLRHGEGVLGEEQLEDARKQLQEVERRLGRLRLICRTDDTTVKLDGAAVLTGPGSHEAWVEPSAHEITVERRGYRSEVKRVTVSPGQLQELELKLNRVTELAHTVQRWPAWLPPAVAASGGVIIAAGAGLHTLSALNFRSYDDKFQHLNCWAVDHRGCRPEDIPPELKAQLRRARLQQSIAVGSYVLGVSMVAAGIALSYLHGLGPAEQRPGNLSTEGVAVVPAVSADMLGVSIHVNR